MRPPLLRLEDFSFFQLGENRAALSLLAEVGIETVEALISSVFRWQNDLRRFSIQHNNRGQETRRLRPSGFNTVEVSLRQFFRGKYAGSTTKKMFEAYVRFIENLPIPR